MKKRILFIEEGLGIGGAEKSLITILQKFDYEKYEVDLFLFDHTGNFIPLLPKEVNLLAIDKDFNIFNSNRKASVLKFIKKGKFKKALNSFLYLINAGISNIFLKKQYIGWKYIGKIFSSIEKEYDVAISFLERKTIYYNVDKVKANNRIGFIHIDYHKIHYDYQADKKYFNYYSKIATVSDHCKEVLEDIFPEYKDKFTVIKNMISPEVIREMAKEKLELEKENNEINIVTVGRLTGQKGIDNAIKVCRELLDMGYNFKWYVVGKGGEEKNLKKMILDYKVEDNFILLGAQINPYKYINFADIYVQPSRFEGYGITIAEAKALQKPIVATNIPEFQEQLINNETGLLCNDNSELRDKIIDLIENIEKRDLLSKALINDKSLEDNEELRKLYLIIN